MNTPTNRFRGHAGRRIAAAIVAAAALGLGATACGPDDNAASSSGSSTASPAKSDPGKSGEQGEKGQKGEQGEKGQKGQKGQKGAKGHPRVYVGTLKYLAPGKMTIKPESGDTEQAFNVSNNTKILGASTICSDGGGVSTGKDGYGTAKCTEAQLEKAAKTNSVSVRVTMNPKTGIAKKVEEKYHP